MNAPDARARLADLMDQRRRDLRLTWDEVASRAGIHRETLRQIRNGSGDIRPLSATGIEDALEWERGSVEALLHGEIDREHGRGSFVKAAPPLPENLAALIGSTDSTAPPEDALAEVAGKLAETTANLDAYIERRAQEIAAPRVAAAERQARDLVAAVWHVAACSHRRQKDLEQELRRQVDVAWQSYERLKETTDG